MAFVDESVLTPYFADDYAETTKEAEKQMKVIEKSKGKELEDSEADKTIFLGKYSQGWGLYTSARYFARDYEMSFAAQNKMTRSKDTGGMAEAGETSLYKTLKIGKYAFVASETYRGWKTGYTYGSGGPGGQLGYSRDLVQEKGAAVIRWQAGGGALDKSTNQVGYARVLYFFHTLFLSFFTSCWPAPTVHFLIICAR